MVFLKRLLNTPILVLLAIEAALLLYFPPSLIFDPNMIAGGDTPSHFISAESMHDPSSFISPVTWIHGNFAGFPLFLQYFPLPFMIMRLISFLTPIQVSFRLVTVLAVVPLPAAVFFCLRRLGFRGLAPALGAVLSLPFLVQSGNHMWGGNIASTMAGEFAYGISLILTIIYTGRIFTDAPRGKSLPSNSILEALIALGNGYPILQAGAGAGYFILRGGCARYVLAMHALAFCLIGYWILPLLWFSGWNSPYAHSWSFQSGFDIAPYLLWPSIAGAVIGAIPHVRALPNVLRNLRASPAHNSTPNPEQYLWWQFLTAILLFSLASSAGLVDARFLPFAQIFITMLGAIGWGKVISRLPRPNFWLVAVAAASIAFSIGDSATINSWIRYNYTGMQSKPLWRSFSEVCRFFEGTQNNPRVMYEHSEILNDAGTTRAFEMLPRFSGRSTLEGLYMQSTHHGPVCLLHAVGTFRNTFHTASGLLLFEVQPRTPGRPHAPFQHLGTDSGNREYSERTG